MDKHAIRIEINNLLDAHCKDCKLVVGQDTLPICKTCPYYKILRQLGDRLITDSDKSSDRKVRKSLYLTACEYLNFKYSGMMDQEIARLKDVTHPTLSKWKRRHKEELQMPNTLMTVDQYKGFVAKGLDASKIAAELKTTKQAIYAWKYNHKAEIEKAPKTDEKAPKTDEAEKSPNQTVVGKISTKCKAQEKEIAELNRRIEALIADKEQAANRYEIAHARKIEAEGNLRLTKDDLKSSKETIDSLQIDIDAFNKTLNETGKENDTMTDQIKQLQKDKKDLLKSTQNQAGTIEKMQKSLGNAIENYKEKCNQIDNLNDASEDLENEIAQLKNDNNDLQQQLTYAQRAQDAAEKKATELQAQYSAATAFIVTLLAR
ncbi:MAG: hypothetical protein ABF820_08595 [Sporolactobacillus sp.]